MNLREIAQEFRFLIDAANDGELDAELESRLDKVAGNLNSKHDAVRSVMAELQARGEARSVEAERVNALAVTDKAAVTRLAAWLMLGMKEAGLKTIETDLFQTSIVNNGGKPSVLYDGQLDNLPGKFVKVTENKSLNRDEVLAAHKAGECLPDGIRVERGQHLRLR